MSSSHNPVHLLESVRAVLFDIDGTLLDTFDFIYGAFEHTFAVHHIPPLDRSTISELMGGPLERVYATMAPGHDPDALTETHRQFQTDNILLTRLFPSTIDVLENLKGRQMKIAAITTRSSRTSRRSLESVGIIGYFDLILSAEDVTHHKPHPEPVQKALQLLDLSPDDAVMVGDTYADVMVGKAANIRTVAALYGFGGDRLLALEPDYAIRDLRELLEILTGAVSSEVIRPPR